MRVYTRHFAPYYWITIGMRAEYRAELTDVTGKKKKKPAKKTEAEKTKHNTETIMDKYLFIGLLC